jgi:hypothetical protein
MAMSLRAPRLFSMRIARRSISSPTLSPDALSMTSNSALSNAHISTRISRPPSGTRSASNAEMRRRSVSLPSSARFTRLSNASASAS